MTFGVSPATGAGLAPPLGAFLQLRNQGADIGDRKVAVLDIVGPRLIATRGVGEKAHVVTVRRVQPPEVRQVDLNGASNSGPTSAVGILLTGFTASAVYRITQPLGRLYAGYSPWPSDGSALPPTTPSDQKWGNAFCVTGGPGAPVGNGDARSFYFGLDRGFPDGETARAAFAAVQITGYTEYVFWVPDGSPSDNRGGISLLIERLGTEYVPGPPVGPPPAPAPSFAVTPRPLAARPADGGLVQFLKDGIEVGDGRVATVNIVGPGLVATRGVGANAHIVTIRRVAAALAADLYVSDDGSFYTTEDGLDFYEVG